MSTQLSTQLCIQLFFLPLSPPFHPPFFPSLQTQKKPPFQATPLSFNLYFPNIYPVYHSKKLIPPLIPTSKTTHSTSKAISFPHKKSRSSKRHPSKNQLFTPSTNTITPPRPLHPAPHNKNKYYVAGLGLYAISKYSGKKEVTGKVWTYLDTVENKRILDEYIPKEIEGKKEKLTLDYALVSGMKVIVLAPNENIDTIKDNPELITKRLYVYKRPDGKNSTTIYLLHHLFTGKDLDNKEIKGKSINNYKEDIPLQIRQSLTALNLLVEGKDFVVTPLGEIRFL